jgi:hypothetical protein
MAVEVKTKADSLELSNPTALFELAAGKLEWQVLRCRTRRTVFGEHLATNGEGAEFSLVVNWPVKLKK